MKINSNAKGKTGEREFANFLKPFFPGARRGQQFKGTPDSPDVIVPGLEQFHFEVKRTESLSLYPTMEKAREDAGDATAILAHRRNGKEWLIVMYAGDWIRLVRDQELEDILSE